MKNFLKNKVIVIIIVIVLSVAYFSVNKAIKKYNVMENDNLDIEENLNKKNNLDKTSEFTVADEKNMVLIGFIGFLDPPKESAKSSIEKLNKNGIRVIVLTGDNVEVTKCVCDKVGIKSKKIVTGAQIDKLADLGVKRLLKKTNIFAKLSPIQKARIVRLLRDDGNIVGYMGDGINDSPSLINSDVGISVDTAVDIAKESADIILLEKDLNVLLDGVEERKTYICKLNEIYQNGNEFQLWRSCICNCSKYIFAIFTGNTNSIIS